MNVFANPWFLVGLAGAAIPILIHILTRDRIRRVAFSTLRFFAQGARTTLRRKRFTELLLILLRVLACVLAALVFARPFIPVKQGVDGKPVFPSARMVVVDVSASMVRAGGAPALAEEARRAVRDAPSGAAIGLLTFDQTVRDELPLGGSAGDLESAVGRLTPGERGTDIAVALRRASEALRAVSARRRDIVLVSDLQRQGLAGYRGDWKLDAGVSLVLAPLQPAPGSMSVAIVDAEFPQRLVRDGQPRSITVRIANAGTNDLADVPVTLQLAGKEVDRQSVRLPAAKSVAVRFRRVIDTPGDNPGEVRVLVEDNDPGDNLFRFNARVIPEIPVLLVGRGEPGPSDRSSFFLQAALRPTAGSPFVVAARAVGRVTAADIAAAAVVVLADVATLDASLVSAIARRLEAGGGLLFLPGDAVTPDAFWRTWSSVAPARLRRILTRRSAEGLPEGLLAKVDFTHPVFEPFQRPHSGDFATVCFSRYWEVGESQASRVPARFDDGRPAILERAVGQGLAVMWLSPVDLDWNNLPLRAIYLPLLHETVRQLAVQTEERTVFSVDAPPALPAGAVLKTADGKPVDDAATAWAPGFYTLTGTNTLSVCYAVNRSIAEADAQTMKSGELKAAFERSGNDDRGAHASGGGEKRRGGRELWWALAAVLALLLPCELWVANRTARH